MAPIQTQECQTPAGKPWWREAEAAWLLLLILGVYFLRAGTLPIRGEEPTRAQIAREMVERGDWLIPREQGDPFLIRPPLQNWLIAASCLAFGSWDAWAVRFHSLLATLLTTLMIYGYSRTCLSRVGALAAAVVFATMVDMFQMGRQAETEALFIFLLSGALMTWHWGIVRRWPDVLTWASGYALMSLAMLTKGVQAPMYFTASVGLYLVLSGQWQRLFTRAHLVGGLLGAAILAAWVVPYGLVMGLSGVRLVWTGDAAVRIQNWNLHAVAVHMLTYPLEIVAGTLPWSLLLAPYLRRDFRRSIQEARPQVLFLTLCMAVAFPTCWIHPGGKPRFFAPLYPCLAVLIGLAVERCSETAASVSLRTFWRRYLAVLVCGMVLAAFGVVAAAAVSVFHPPLKPFAEPPLVAVGYAVACIGLAAAVWRIREGGTPARTRTAVLALAGFLGVAFTGVVTDVRLQRSENATEAMKQLKEQLPAGQPLVSLGGHLDCLFSYYYGQPFITPRPWPTDGKDCDLTYFCFQCPGDRRPQLPFAWQEIGVVPLDRNHHAIPEGVVVVGLRAPVPTSQKFGPVARSEGRR